MSRLLLLVMGIVLLNLDFLRTHEIANKDDVSVTNDNVVDEVGKLKKEQKRLSAKLNNLAEWNMPMKGPTVLEDGRLLVFRITPNTGTSAWGTFTARGYNDDNPIVHTSPNCGCMSTNDYHSCDRHYRSRFLDYWPSYLIDTVRVSVYELGIEMAYVEFNGRGSNYLNWFSRERVLSSSWTDLKSAAQNYFSIDGDNIPGTLERRFFINHSYAGCDQDFGWLVVLDRPEGCNWSKASQASVPVILYSKRNTFVNYNAKGDVGRADVLTVTVKLRDDVDLNNQCFH